jgi:phage repressor protein C with HTH and peptisase S24 domain
MSIDQRAALARLIEERREDYSGLSRLLGRNAAYIQQFVKRGVPRKLSEDDRRTLARYFNVDEAILGGPHTATSGSADDLIAVQRLDISASAGAGALPGVEAGTSHLGFREAWLRQLAEGSFGDLSLITVQGDSMAPALADGDDIMVNRADGAERLRDGIYVLRREDSLLVKRIAMSPSARRVAVQSDNPAYPSWPDVDRADIDIIGRVIWCGRRIS